jgi:hypothetical protein
MLTGMRLSARVLDAESFLGTTIDQTAAPASYHCACLAPLLALPPGHS